MSPGTVLRMLPIVAGIVLAAGMGIMQAAANLWRTPESVGAMHDPGPYVVCAIALCGAAISLAAQDRRIAQLEGRVEQLEA